MKRDPWILYCEAYRDLYPNAKGGDIVLSPAVLDQFYRKVMEAECTPPEGGLTMGAGNREAANVAGSEGLKPNAPASLPICSAPKDEHGIIAFSPKFYQGRGGWVAAVWMKDGWHSNPGGWHFEPTHWLPMPATPTPQEDA